MKIGIICEGEADKKVFDFLAKQISSNVDVAPPVAHRGKSDLIKKCGASSKALLELNSCECVVIIWDLQPAWKEKNQKACRREDCDLIRQSLNAAQLNKKQLNRVHLVCMEQELETLFLTDEQMIAKYLTQKSKRSCSVKYFRNPDHPQNAKGEIEKIFQMYSGRAHRYVDTIDAEKMIQHVNIKKLRRCASFVRFAMKITDERHVSQRLGIPLTQLMPERKSQEEEQ